MSEKLCPDCGHAGKYHAFPGCTFKNPRTLPGGIKVDTCGCTGMNWVGEEELPPKLEEGERYMGMVICPMCKGKNPDCKHCKGKGKLKMKVASTTEVDYNSVYVDEVLAAIKEATGIGNAFITDLSSVWDFLDVDKKKESKALSKLSEILGLKVNGPDTIVGLAKKLKKLRER